MKLKIAVLPGDGIGPEIMKQGVAVMDAIAEKFDMSSPMRRLFVAPMPLMLWVIPILRQHTMCV